MTKLKTSIIFFITVFLNSLTAPVFCSSTVQLLSDVVCRLCCIVLDLCVGVNNFEDYNTQGALGCLGVLGCTLVAGAKTKISVLSTPTHYIHVGNSLSTANQTNMTLYSQLIWRHNLITIILTWNSVHTKEV